MGHQDHSGFVYAQVSLPSAAMSPEGQECFGKVTSASQTHTQRQSSGHQTSEADPIPYCGVGLGCNSLTLCPCLENVHFQAWFKNGTTDRQDKDVGKDTFCQV